MALYAPERVFGLGLNGATFDSASQGSIDRGCADVTAMITEVLNLTAKPEPNFKLPADYKSTSANAIFGPEVKEDSVQLWANMLNSAYNGDEGRVKLQQAAIAMLSRDSLHMRVGALALPILWIQGDGDTVASVKNAQYEIGLTKSSDPTLAIVKGGYHATTFTHVEETQQLILAFVKKHGGVRDARALRESVGTIEM